MEFSTYEEALEFLKGRNLKAEITQTSYGYWVDVDRKRIFATEQDEREAEEYFAELEKGHKKEKARVTIHVKDTYTFKQLKGEEIAGTFYVISYPKDLDKDKTKLTYFRAKKYAENVRKAKTTGEKPILTVKVDKNFLK